MYKEVGPPCYRQLKIPKYNSTIIELTLKTLIFVVILTSKSLKGWPFHPGKHGIWNFSKKLEEPKIS